MAGYQDRGINDGTYAIASGNSGFSGTVLSITKPGTYLLNTPSGVVSNIVLSSGVWGVNGLNPAIRVVDQAGTFAQSVPYISGATGSNITFNGASRLQLTTAYQTYTGVMFSGASTGGGNFITQ